MKATTTPAPVFTDHKFMSAAEKSRVLKAWVTFLRHGLQDKHFTKGLYQHVIQHAAFIAHYSRHDFYGVYFDPADPDATRKFLAQFDPDGPGVSVEYGETYWLYNEAAGDLNQAMREAARPFLPALREGLYRQALANADARRRSAEAELARLQATAYSQMK